MGANVFVFRVPEKASRLALQAAVACRLSAKEETDYALEVSVNLIPDGIGYEASDLSIKIVEDTGKVE